MLSLRIAKSGWIREFFMSPLGLILLIVIVMLVVGSVPAWPHSRGWGYGPSGGLGLILAIVIVLLLLRAI